MKSDFGHWYALICVVAIIKGIEAYVRPAPGGGLLMAFADGMTAVVVFATVSSILIGLWGGAMVWGHKLTDGILYAIAVLAALVGLRQLMALWNAKFGLNVNA